MMLKTMGIKESSKDMLGQTSRCCAGMRARGHCMFWAVPHHQTPAWVEQLQGEDLVEAVEEHVDNLLEHFEAGVAMVALALVCQT